jgi:hypothetical protein
VGVLRIVLAVIAGACAVGLFVSELLLAHHAVKIRALSQELGGQPRRDPGPVSLFVPGPQFWDYVRA